MNYILKYIFTHKNIGCKIIRKMIVTFKNIDSIKNFKYLIGIFYIVFIYLGCEKISAHPNKWQFTNFDVKKNQVGSLCYSNLAINYDALLGYQSGFKDSINDLNDRILLGADRIRNYSILQIIFTAVPVTLALVHLLLFLFNFKARDNLIHSLFLISFAVLCFSYFEMNFTDRFNKFLISINLGNVSINMTLLFGLLITYWKKYKFIPFRFYLFLAGFVIFILLNSLWPNLNFYILFYIFLAITVTEIIRICITTIRLSEDKDWISLIGLIILIIAIVFQILIDQYAFESAAYISIFYLFGVLTYSIALSLNLVYDFAYSNRQLIIKEREIREKEIERRVMEADYSRKTEELEEARRLQVGMLPREVPKLSHLDIAVYMKTATEVGGDYYDFNETADGTLTIAIGDATGHGIKAGVMVALVKSLFNTMAHTFFIPDFFTHCTKMIRKMNFYNLYMCLMLVRITNYQLKVSAAGMPPLLIYRKENNQVEDIVVKGLPLGGPVTARYEQKQAVLKSGDTILMMTDGYTDLFNPAMETFDLERVKEVFLQNGTKKPNDIINALVKEGELWRDSQPQDDDITFVVIKVKN